MQLHRTTGRPDWEDIPAAQRTHWQRMAASTHGVVTPANIVSLLGLLLVISGLICLLYHQYVACLVLVVIGRLADIADGAIAQKTRTKSPIGEAVDAAMDKIVALLALGAFAAAHIAPLWVLIVIAIQNISNVVFAYAARRRGNALHPSASGKLATAGQWVALALFIVAAASGNGYQIAMIVADLTIGLGLYASVEYARDTFKRRA
jgi:phosphatidylglycerophosphate synthase